MKLLFFALLIVLTSCSSIRKGSASSRISKDGTAVQKTDSIILAKTDSVGLKKETSTINTTVDSSGDKTTTEEEISYIQAEDLPRRDTSIARLDAQPGTVVTITRRTIHERGAKRTETKIETSQSDSVSKKKVDSLGVQHDSKVTIKTDEATKSKTVSRKKLLPGLIWLLVILIISWITYRYYLWRTKNISFLSFINNSSHDKKTG